MPITADPRKTTLAHSLRSLASLRGQGKCEGDTDRDNPIMTKHYLLRWDAVWQHTPPASAPPVSNQRRVYCIFSVRFPTKQESQKSLRSLMPPSSFVVCLPACLPVCSSVCHEGQVIEFAEQRGSRFVTNTKVTSVRPLPNSGKWQRFLVATCDWL